MKETINIIPYPSSAKKSEGEVKIKSKSFNLSIEGSDSPKFTGKIKNAVEITGCTINKDGYPLSIIVNEDLSRKNNASYTLHNDENGITIKASSEKGAFYGCISAGQLLQKAEDTLSFMDIEDNPEYEWRGFLLDTCRSFYSVNFIKKMLRACALHKLNIFHWHLTDDQGWRFNVEEYPELIKTGAHRQDMTVPESEEGFYDEGKEIRRWYTDEEIKEIIEYGENLNIEIIPEVEFPGHSSALLAAYPEFGCTGGPYKVENRWGIFPDVLCLGNDSVFKIYEAAVKKIISLFPSKYIHIGGDECLPDRWSNCPKCRARMEKENLDSPAQLQAWATTKVAKMISDYGKIPIGWDEVLDNNKHNQLPDNVIVQSWRGIEGGIKAVSLKHKVIMSPCDYFYLNFKNCDSFEEPGRLGVTSTKKTYTFSPSGKNIAFKSPDEKKYILGGECTLWTEKLPHSRTAEYLLFPRFCAAAESLWQNEENKDFENFKERLSEHKKLLKKLDYYFYDGQLE